MAISNPGRNIPCNHTKELSLAHVVKKATGGSLPFKPCETAGQSTERLLQPLNRLAHVTMFLLVIPDCATSLRPEDSIDGSIVIASP